MPSNVDAKDALLRRIEFIVATGIFLLSLFSLEDEENTFLRVLQHATVYGSFLILNFYSLPGIMHRRKTYLHAGIILIIFMAYVVVFGVWDVGFAAYSIFGIYAVVRYTAFFLWTQSEVITAKYKFIAPGTLLAFFLWLISFILLLVGEADPTVIITWATIIPVAIALYTYSFYSIIPDALLKQRAFLPYAGKAFLSQLVVGVPIFLSALALLHDEDDAFVVVVMNTGFQLLVTVPITWKLYKIFIRSTEELTSLETKLGQSTASLDFLRSQINPHFLFNALNTLYATALREKAETTADAVQKLGDMMRFMLHDNVQEKIPLSTELDYLSNYIAFQRLRTDTATGIVMDLKLPADVPHLVISPMLLIPFVENAFKHGVSVHEPSHLNMNVEVKDKVLYFDVSNSKHTGSENDPEKEKGGIGLSNVRSRLEILYPSRHELLVRDTPSEFFVHLTLTLS